MKEVDYSYSVTREDKIRVFFRKNRGKITHFIVQYYALIHARWRTIMRIDTCHGYPHKHTYHLRDRETVLVLGTMESSNFAFTESRQFIHDNFTKIKENYLIAK